MGRHWDNLGTMNRKARGILIAVKVAPGSEKRNGRFFVACGEDGIYEKEKIVFEGGILDSAGNIVMNKVWRRRTHEMHSLKKCDGLYRDWRVEAG